MNLLSVRDLRVEVGRARLPVVDGVDLDIPRGTVVGLVGESGCGKSTLARAIVGLLPARSGRILLDGRDYRGSSGPRLRRFRRRVQLVFQDPRASLNPRMTVGEGLSEALRAGGAAAADPSGTAAGLRGGGYLELRGAGHPALFGGGHGARLRAGHGAIPGAGHPVGIHEKASGGFSAARASAREQVAGLLTMVALNPGHAQMRPGALSGGQRQRVALARALATRPDLIIADEVTSALDASIQASVLNLLRRLCAQTGVSVLFISHNLSVVRYMSETIAVMQLGRIVEQGPTGAVLDRPAHPYTRILVGSASLQGFTDDGGFTDEGDPVAELPDPLHLPSGCRFRTLCPVGPAVDPARELCVREDPARGAGSRTHRAACHYAPSVPA
jgi:oligopeptide/dipeptide ABC transporter ATP-binding protein